HMTLFRIAPTAVLGIVLTAIAIWTGSIFPGMALHMGNNAWGVWAGMHDFDADSLGPWHSAAMIAIFVLSMWIIYRNRERPGTSRTSSSRVNQIQSARGQNGSGRQQMAD